jgi:hypothetical protein
MDLFDIKQLQRRYFMDQTTQLNIGPSDREKIDEASQIDGQLVPWGTNEHGRRTDVLLSLLSFSSEFKVRMDKELAVADQRYLIKNDIYRIITSVLKAFPVRPYLLFRQISKILEISET